MTEPRDDLDGVEDQLRDYAARWQEASPPPPGVPLDRLHPRNGRISRRTPVLVAATVMLAIAVPAAVLSLRDGGPNRDADPVPAPMPSLATPPAPTLTSLPRATCPAGPRGPGSFTVQHTIFSGRRDPEWKLDRREAAALRAALRSSTADVYPVEYGPDRLGGYLVEADPRERAFLTSVGLGLKFWVIRGGAGELYPPDTATPGPAGPVESVLAGSEPCHPESGGLVPR